MARSTVAFTNFTAGELSPRLDGRTDLGKYFNGSKTLENMIVHPHGAATRRPGTKFIHEVKTSSAQTRLIPFEFSTTQTYIMEFGHQYIRFFKDNGIITESNKTISGATQANPIVITSNSHGYNNGDFVIISVVVGMTELNGKTFKVADKTTNTFELQTVDGTDINSSAYTAYGSGGVANKIYEIASPYSTADLPTIKFAQSADLMYLVHPGYAIRKLTRSGHTNWTLSTPSLSGTPSPTINNATDKYPSSVSFFEQRLVFAGSNDNPQTMWFSKSADLENFTTGTNDTDAMVYTIASNKVNAIRYISAQRSLIVGTVGGEFVVSASGTTQPITPTNVQIQRQSSYGAANIDAVQIENVTMFVQRAKRKLRELSYNLNIDQYQAQDMTLLAEHITEGGVLEMAYQQEPDSILWCVRNDGTLLGFTYARAEEVVGWHRHILGGAFGSGQAVVESVASIPTDANEDEFRIAFERLLISNHILAKAVVPGMKKMKWGRIINIISTSVRQVIPGLGVSNTIRGSVAQWGKTLALELGEFGITVNNILPGYTATTRLKELAKSKSKSTGLDEKDIYDLWASNTSVKRLGTPEEIAESVAFLASDASGYISGHNLSIDGGRFSA